ncbi:UNVERIFIED_CONTAM: hypothetical protein Sradi_2331500 [Sesamum radiatum]|uniref:Reverse transcriptase zinc-binding domain-containing protein n=1 Tax=Sesamum radiatum TaxID=300843 RepID=A0AAW2T5R4_SESRA
MFTTKRSTGSSSLGPPNWNFIWQTEVPPKVRLFAWKICRDALPTRLRLMRRGVQTSSGCVWCGRDDEDLLHVLLRCHYPRLVWALSAIPFSSLVCGHNSPESWLRGLYQRLKKDSFSRVLLICWFLWWARNKLIFENTSIVADALLDRVLGYEACLQKRFLGAEGQEASRQAHHSIPETLING